MNEDIGTRRDHNQDSIIYQTWEKNGYFSSKDSHASKNSENSKDPQEQEKFTILLPPPNVTGNLHIGHALNTSILDALFRYHKMSGKDCLWIPGTDHAGIATQSVVLKHLYAQSKEKFTYTREELIGHIHKWKVERHSYIMNQLRMMGVSCDWSREQWTMSEKFSDHVMDAFQTLYDANLIYRGQRSVNWCCNCHTTLSDDEVTHQEKNGKLYYIKYQIVTPNTSEQTHIVVATTRPETILADMAMAHNFEESSDQKTNIPTTVIVPIVNRQIPVIRDQAVNPEFGSGYVKVTPAHSKIDYDIYQRANLSEQYIDVIDDDGKICNTNTDYDGHERFVARKMIVAQLTNIGLVDKIEEHKNSVGCCYRCNFPIEQRISTQWFVKMQELAQKADQCIDSGEVNLYPAFQSKIYKTWTKGIQDWCISRQIVWGTVFRLTIVLIRNVKSFTFQKPLSLNVSVEPSAHKILMYLIHGFHLACGRMLHLTRMNITLNALQLMC